MRGGAAPQADGGTGIGVDPLSLGKALPNPIPHVRDVGLGPLAEGEPAPQAAAPAQRPPVWNEAAAPDAIVHDHRAGDGNRTRM